MKRPLVYQESNSKVVAGNDGGYYLLYNLDTLIDVGGFSMNSIRLYIEKYDSNNIQQWQHVFEQLIIPSQIGYPVVCDLSNAKPAYDGGIIYGKFVDANPYGTGYIEKLKPDGTVDWDVNIANMMNVPNIDYAFSYFIFSTSDSCIVTNVAASVNGLSNQGLYKIDRYGNVVDSVFWGQAEPVAYGVELSNGKYLFDNTYQTGFSIYDKHLNYLSSTPGIVNEYTSYQAYAPVANAVGGALWISQIGDIYNPGTLNLRAVNFDSLFNTYPNIISGNIYQDNNNDCQADPGDFNISNSQVKFSGGGDDYYAFANSYGHYTGSIPDGSYSVTHPVFGYTINECPAVGYSYNVVGPSNNTGVDFFDALIPNIKHLKVEMCGDEFAPGYDAWLNVGVINYGTVTANATVQIIKDNAIDYISSIPAPISISGDTLTYMVANLSYDSSMNISIHLNVNPALTVGTPLTFTANAMFENNIYLSDTTDTLNTMVVSSFDPNSKTVNKPLYYTAARELVYKVHFQNTGTAAARNVLVADSIDKHLDISTFKLVSASPSIPAISWRDGNALYFNFQNINLPDSLVNPAGSQGYFIYSITPKLNVAIGDTIMNRAYIYFDYNAPIITDSTINILTGLPTELKNTLQNVSPALYPNPSSGDISVKLPTTGDKWLITVTGIDGKKIIDKEYKPNENIINLKMDVSDGLYFVKINNLTTRIVTTKKLVIAH